MSLFRPELADLNPIRRAHAQADCELSAAFLRRLIERTSGQSDALEKIIETTHINLAMAERVLDGHSNN